MSADKIVNKDDRPTLAGSVFLNNTSYSGCDIKVVVNIYDSLKTGIDRTFQLQTDIVKLQAQIKGEISQREKIRNRFIKILSNTPESQNLSIRLRNLNKSIRQNQSTLQDLEQSMSGLQKNKDGNTGQATTMVLATAQTLSVSTHRDKQAVRACGSVYPKAFTRGPRQVAGSMVFTVFDEHVLHSLLEAHASDFDAVDFTAAMLDQLPPVDITVAFANEYGSISRMAIHGVEFVDEGQVMSIEDIMTEMVVNWVARDIDPMRSVSSAVNETSGSSANLGKTIKRASDLILEEDYQAVKQKLDPYTRFNRRRNPFL